MIPLALDLEPVVAPLRAVEPSHPVAVQAPAEPSAPPQERHLRALSDGEPSLLPGSAHGGRTLEDLLSGAWEDITAHRAAACPICDGAMAPRYGSGPSPVGARCRDCGAELA